MIPAVVYIKESFRQTGDGCPHLDGRMVIVNQWFRGPRLG